MANTTWNPSDKAAGFTLSGSNLIATLVSGTTPALVRSVDKQIAGKFYFELTANVQGGTGAEHYGLISGTTPTTGGGTGSLSSPGTCWVNNSAGTIWSAGISWSTSLGTLSNGSLLGIAFDA